MSVQRVVGRIVRHESYSGVRVTRQAVAITDSGEEFPCKHSHGHRSMSALRRCAAQLVAEISRKESAPAVPATRA